MSGVESKRDTIVVGGSAGGLDALRSLLARLPADIDASILAVLHVSRTSTRLHSVLQSATALRVVTVVEAVRPEHGTVYLASADRHLILRDGLVRTVRGPRENRSRPSINALFRTAAVARGARVMGVLLSGMLDDGVVGLDAIRRCGGRTWVQCPDEAAFPDMPDHAIAAGVADRVDVLDIVATELLAQVGRPVRRVDIPHDLVVEARMAGPDGGLAAEPPDGGVRGLGACPECGGPLLKVGGMERAVYRCPAGHTLARASILESQYGEIETALWVSVRALSERASMLERMAKDAGPRNSATYVDRALEARQQADQVKSVLLTLRGSHLQFG